MRVDWRDVRAITDFADAVCQRLSKIRSVQDIEIVSYDKNNFIFCEK